MNRSLFVCFAMLLTACAGPLAQGLRSEVKIEAASANSVVIGPVSSASDSAAERLATEHCKKYGLNARFPRMVSASSVHYQCWP